MSFDFSRIAELSTARGKLVELKNSAGRVIWAVKSADGGKVILEVEKITSDTYAGETTYTGESFILLDIYPKTNGTVKVTYGGLTKTISDTSGAEEPNARQVYFGTFNGVSDEVETPASGELVIEGACVGFACGAYHTYSSKNDFLYCSCITGVTEWGGVSRIPDYAFYECIKMVSCEMPDSILSIGQYACYYCSGITALKISNSITAIPNNAFSDWIALREVTIPAGVTEIGVSAFVSIRSGADSLTVTMLSTTPPSLITKTTGGNVSTTSYPFSRNGVARFIVPKGCGNTYKTAEVWSKYADYIMEAS